MIKELRNILFKNNVIMHDNTDIMIDNNIIIQKVGGVLNLPTTWVVNFSQPNLATKNQAMSIFKAINRKCNESKYIVFKSVGFADFNLEPIQTYECEDGVYVPTKNCNLQFFTNNNISEEIQTDYDNILENLIKGIVCNTDYYTVQKDGLTVVRQKETDFELFRLNFNYLNKGLLIKFSEITQNQKRIYKNILLEIVDKINTNEPKIQWVDFI